MNHYDDLQRFKEKTRTQSLNFKDLSSQAAAREQGDWAILNQLAPKEETEASLAMGGSVSLPVPQSVSADAFRFVAAPVAPAAPPVAPAPLMEAAPVYAAPVAPPAAAPVYAAPAAQPAVAPVYAAPAAPPAAAPVYAAPAAQPAAAPVYAAPAAQPAVAPVYAAPPAQPAAVPLYHPRPVTASPGENYAHLFVAKTEEPVAKNKDQPLKSLLERIATCR